MSQRETIDIGNGVTVSRGVGPLRPEEMTSRHGIIILRRLAEAAKASADGASEYMQSLTPENVLALCDSMEKHWLHMQDVLHKSQVMKIAQSVADLMGYARGTAMRQLLLSIAECIAKDGAFDSKHPHWEQAVRAVELP
jgi:hypothetical protein